MNHVKIDNPVAELRVSLRGDRLALEQNFLLQGKASRLLSDWIIDLYVIHDRYLYSNRHSGAGRNPDNYQYPHEVGQHPKCSFVRYAEIYDKLDSGLRRNDVVTGFAC